MSHRAGLPSMTLSQPDLFDRAIPADDADRLKNQLASVRAIMLDYRPHTLAEIGERIGALTTSASARIRELRQPAKGGHIIKKTLVSKGLYAYYLVRS